MNKQNNQPYVAPSRDYHQILTADTPEIRNAEMQLKREQAWNHPVNVVRREAKAAADQERREIDAEDEAQGFRAGKIHQSLIESAGNIPSANARANAIWAERFEGRKPYFSREELNSAQQRDALKAIAALIDDCEAKLPDWIAEIAALRDQELRAKAEAREAAIVAKAQAFAQGMSHVQVLDYLEKDRRAVLRLTKHGLRSHRTISPAMLMFERWFVCTVAGLLNCSGSVKASRLSSKRLITDASKRYVEEQN